MMLKIFLVGFQLHHHDPHELRVLTKNLDIKSSSPLT